VSERPSTASAFREGLFIWYPLFAPVVLWMIHLVGLAAVVRESCLVPAHDWTMHGLTIVTGAGTIAGALLAWRLMAANNSGTDDSADTERGRLRFLGLLGLIVALTNLLLILAEEGMVLAFVHHACG
jgi:hypothetical protein